MGKVMRHTLGASLNIRHNLSSSKGPKPLQLKLLTTYIPKTSAFTLAFSIFFFQAEDGIRATSVTGVQTCALPILATKSVFHGDGGEDSMVVTVWLDITERKGAERDLLAAKEQAELANRSKTEFLANMSHETRTPLNAIIGFSQVIAGEMLGPIGTPKYIGYAHDILVSAEHLLGIINDILDLSKLEAGKLDLVEEVIDVPRLMEDLLQLADAKARASEIRVALRYEGTIPALRADARKVKQIVLNLLINAVKFSHPGSEVAIVVRNQSGAVV